MNRTLQVRSALLAEQLPAPSQAWLQALLNEQHQRPNLALPQLVALAKAALLAADLTTPGLLDSMAATAHSFPADIGSAEVQEARLAHSVVVQVLDLENLAQSRWQQVQELEAIERGEQKRGREIIRVVPSAGEDGGEDGSGGGGGGGGGHGGRGNAGGAPAATTAPAANATHRLVLQDCLGRALFGLELTRLPRIGVGRTSIGEKLLIKRGAVVARGVVLLEPANVVFLGGRIEALHKAWTDGRLARLRAAAQAPSG